MSRPRLASVLGVIVTDALAGIVPRLQCRIVPPARALRRRHRHERVAGQHRIGDRYVRGCARTVIPEHHRPRDVLRSRFRHGEIYRRGNYELLVLVRARRRVYVYRPNIRLPIVGTRMIERYGAGISHHTIHDRFTMSPSATLLVRAVSLCRWPCRRRLLSHQDRRVVHRPRRHFQRRWIASS